MPFRPSVDGIGLAGRRPSFCKGQRGRENEEFGKENRNSFIHSESLSLCLCLSHSLCLCLTVSLSLCLSAPPVTLTLCLYASLFPCFPVSLPESWIKPLVLKRKSMCPRVCQQNVFTPSPDQIIFSPTLALPPYGGRRDQGTRVRSRRRDRLR